MGLSAKEKEERKFERMLAESKKLQLGTYRGRVAKEMQKAIRMEAAAHVGYVKAVIDGVIESVHSPLGMVVCVTCGKTQEWNLPSSHAGHFVGGRTDSIVFEEHGVHPQCAHCNAHMHGNPEAYQVYMEDVYGHEVIEDLKLRKRGVVRDVDGREHRIESRTRERLVAMSQGYRQRIKAAKEKLEQGAPSVANTPAIPSVFNYGDLSKRNKERLLETAEQIRKTGRMVAVGVGKSLLEVKHLLPTGEFQMWVEEECGLDYRRAAEWMRVAEVFKSADSAVLERISIQALIDLSAKSCPLEAIEDVIQEANEGYVSYTRAREVIGQHKKREEQKQGKGLLPSGKTPDEAATEAISKLQITVEDQPDPEDPSEETVAEEAAENVEDVDEPMSLEEEWEAIWDEADFSQRMWIIEQVKATDEYQTSMTPPAAVEVEGKVRKVKTPKTKSEKFDPSTVELPHGQEFADAWGDWVEHRKEVKAKLTAKAVQMQLKKLGGWSESRAIACIHHTIENGWKGLREEDGVEKATTTADDLAVV